MEFYKDVFGVDPDFVTEGSGEAVSKAVGVPDAELAFAFLRLGPTILELLEYRNPRGRDSTSETVTSELSTSLSKSPTSTLPTNNSLRSGSEFNAAPLAITEGPLAGCKFAYFSDPDGVQLEIFQVGDDR